MLGGSAASPKRLGRRCFFGGRPFFLGSAGGEGGRERSAGEARRATGGARKPPAPPCVFAVKSPQCEPPCLGRQRLRFRGDAKVREGRRANAGRKRRGRKRPLASPSRPPPSRHMGKATSPPKPGHSAREGTDVPGVSADVPRCTRVFAETQPLTLGASAADPPSIRRRPTQRPSQSDPLRPARKKAPRRHALPGPGFV